MISCGIILTIIVIGSVSPWTIDLPEMRKHVFENNKKYGVDTNNAKNIYTTDERELYSNSKGNSLHNNDDFENEVYLHENYANDYEYGPYMEKKIHEVVRSGSEYLEGLRRAIEDYTKRLENCTRNNITAIQNTTEMFNMTSSNSSNTSLNTTFCSQITNSSEHVRRLADLALSTTRELQEFSYLEEYHADSVEEKTLLLKLAWILDRLAHLTGYDPEPKDYLTSTTRTATSSTPSLPGLNPPKEVKEAMMKCIDMNSTEPATSRCSYSLPVASDIIQLFNTSTSPSPDISVLPPNSNVQPKSQVSSLIETIAPYDEANIIPELPVKTLHKRSVENYLPNVLNYLVKYKVWENSNPSMNPNENKQDFDAVNSLSSAKCITKRSISNKKAIKMRLPEDPMQDISNYVKHKSGTDYKQNQGETQKIKNYLDKIRNSSSSTAKHYASELQKKLRTIRKRSTYYKKPIYPRISENPMKDISFYVKNKDGTEYNPSLTQAAMLRVGLEQVFQTGNIEVVRRFGSNYNPLNPSHDAEGIIRSTADI